MRLSLILLLALSAGCGSAPRATTDRQSPPADSAAAPVLLAGLTDQRTVWDCPKCGMEYDRAGQCGMCHVDLVETRVDYLCAADGKPVVKNGECPRCDAPVQVQRTALAPEPPSQLRGN